MSSTSAPTYSSSYERMSGNCTRILAAQMISTVDPLITDSSYILDNACGPGIVSEQIKLLHPDAKIMAADIAPGMIDQVKQAIKANGWSNMQTQVLDARNLSALKDGSFSHVITNLGLPVLGDLGSGSKITKEMFRVLKTDRVWLTAFYNAAKAVRPTETHLSPMALSYELMRASWLIQQLEEGGFGTNVEVKPCITYTMAASLDELVENMMLARQMFFAKFSDEEIEKVKPIFKEELQKLRTYETFDGGVRIGMKAWVGIGRKLGDEDEVPV